MVSTQIVAVLVGAVLVQAAVAFPMELETQDKEKCTDLMKEAIVHLNDLRENINNLPSLVSNTEAAFKACKQESTPEEVAQCELVAKWESGLAAAALMEDQLKTAFEARALVTKLATCKSAKVEPRDLNACFTAIDASRVQLAELNNLIDTMYQIHKTYMGKGQECYNSDLGDECMIDVVLSTRGEVFVALTNILKWEKNAQQNMNTISQCMAS